MKEKAAQKKEKMGEKISGLRKQQGMTQESLRKIGGERRAYFKN